MQSVEWLKDVVDGMLHEQAEYASRCLKSCAKCELSALIPAIEEEMRQRTEIVRTLYYSAHWTPDRPCIVNALWENVRDVFGFEPGKSPEPSQSETPWKPGQRLVFPGETTSVFKLSCHEHDDFWSFQLWLNGNWGKLTTHGLFPADMYVPWPRVGDWVRSNDCGTVRVEALTVRAFRDNHGFWYSIADLEPATPPEPQKKCGEFVDYLIAGASWYPCALPKGHNGEHLAGGNCFMHGEYLGEPNEPPFCPKCDFSQRQSRTS